MKFLILFALVAITHLQFVASDSTPYCTSQYFSESICAKFDLPQGPDCNPNGGPPYDLNTKNPSRFSNSRARDFAVGITNVFENSEAQNDYATCTNIGDGRGFTCGSGGYTSDDGSMQDPLQRYDALTKKAHKKDILAKYLPEINKIAADSNCSPFRGSTQALSGLDKAWTMLGCTDPLFREAQDESAFAEIDNWAMAHAGFYNIKTNLGLAIFRDTMEQHGDGGGEPHIGIEVIGRKATEALGGKQVGEMEFISEFLTIRRQLLCCYRPEINGKQDLTWPESADRISDLQHLVETGNWDLNPPINLPAYQYTINTNFNLRATPTECKKFQRRGRGKRFSVHNSTNPVQLDN